MNILCLFGFHKWARGYDKVEGHPKYRGVGCRLCKRCGECQFKWEVK